VCGIEKEKYSFDTLNAAEKPDITCNPIGQAEILNKKETELNIFVGLCIEHLTIHQTNGGINYESYC